MPIPNDAIVKLEFERDEHRAAIEQAQSALEQNRVGTERLPLSAVLLLNHEIKRHQEIIASIEDRIFLAEYSHLESFYDDEIPDYFNESDLADDWIKRQDRVHEFTEYRLPQLDRRLEELRTAAEPKATGGGAVKDWPGGNLRELVKAAIAQRKPGETEQAAVTRFAASYTREGTPINPKTAYDSYKKQIKEQTP